MKNLILLLLTGWGFALSAQITVLADANAKPTEKTPGKSAAFFCAKGKKKRIFWSPEKNERRPTGEAALADCTLSGDETLLVLAERENGGAETCDTNLIFFNLCNGRIVHTLKFKNTDVQNVAFFPDHRSLLLVTVPDLSRERLAHLIKIDLQTGRELFRSPGLKTPVRSFVIARNKVFFTQENPAVFQWTPGEANVERQEVKITNPKLAVTPDKDTLICYNEHRLKRFDVPREDGDVLQENGSDAWDGEFKADTLFPADRNGSKLLLIGKEGAAQLQNGVFRKLYSGSCLAGAMRRKDGNFFLAIPFQRSVVYYEQSAGKPVSPGRLKPPSRFDLFRIYAVTGKNPVLLGIDEGANIFKMFILRKRWAKTMIFEASALNR